MSTDRQIWQVWAYNLHRWGLAEWAATVLEATGPLNIIAAQFIYLVQPFVSWTLPDHQWQALTEMLEDSNKSKSFVSLLREVDLQ